MIKNNNGSIDKGENIDTIVEKFDHLFEIGQFGKDNSMGFFLPRVYEKADFDWEKEFESDFKFFFNGLMMRGADNVRNIYLGVFPSENFFNKVFARATRGDLVFLHHPINMDCGDPRGSKGKGFYGIHPDILLKIKKMGLSVYTSHLPMDISGLFGANYAIARTLRADIIGNFGGLNKDYSGLICEIESIDTDSLINKMINIFNIPYVDFIGRKYARVVKIGIMAGGGGNRNYLEEMEMHDIQCGIAGEVTNKINSDWGRREQIQIDDFISHAKAGFIGVSHAASEFLGIKRFGQWLHENTNVDTFCIAEDHWWR